MITKQPVGPSQPVAEGSTVTFTVEATCAEPVTYQWQRGTAIIQGANQKNYQTPPVKWPDDNGATFRVVVTNAKANVSCTSQSATLSVRPPTTGGAVIVNHRHTDLSRIPTSAISSARSSLKIAYGHTSHGSQLVTGMAALASSNSLYAFDETGSSGALLLDDYFVPGDAGYYPGWVDNTRSYLGTPNPVTGRGSSHGDVNVVMWSWCGQLSSLSAERVTNEYLTPMSRLEADYPGIKFVYMTGHLDGSGTNGNLNQRNNQIRTYCQANDKVLFDFADIESYDPSGNEFLSRGATDTCTYSGGNWATQWITANPTDPLAVLANACGSCAHSERLNCIMKGRAAWWLWARLAGWSGE